MAIRVGRWDCPTCSTKGILGPEKSCTVCGAPRPKNVKFYLTDDAEVVTDKKRLEEAKAGADLVCSNCGTHNAATRTVCSTCGNPLSTTADDDIQLGQKLFNLDGTAKEPTFTGTLSGGDTRTAEEIEEEAYHKAGGLTSDIERIKTRRKAIRWSLFVGIPLGMLALVWYLFSTHTEPVTVTGHTWERNINVLAYKNVEEEDWSVPDGGTQTGSFQAIHHYDHVLDHYETRTRSVQVQTGSESVKCGTRDMGNGYFEDVYCDEPIYETREESYEEPIYRDDPVYQTKYRYTVWRWVPDHDITTQGKDTTAVKWPFEAVDGKTFRYGDTNQVYNLLLHSDKRKFDFTDNLPEPRWRLYAPGQKVKVVYNNLGTYKGLEDELKWQKSQKTKE